MAVRMERIDGQIASESSGQRAPSCRPQDSNERLVVRCLDGEAGAWNELVSRYERLVHAIPLREGLGPHDAAEISQATFEALVQSLHRIEKPERLGYWLMTVARRLTWQCRANRDIEVSVAVHALDPATDTSAHEWERTVEIYDAIAELGEPCRSLILGLFFDPAEPSYEDLARELGMSVGTIGPLRGRCLSRLRAILEDLEDVRE